MNISTIISLSVSIISVIFCISTFVRNGNKDTKSETAKDSYQWGRLEERLNNLEKQLDKVLDKLDGYDREIENKVEKAIETHIREYHKGE